MQRQLGPPNILRTQCAFTLPRVVFAQGFWRPLGSLPLTGSPPANAYMLSESVPQRIRR